jgi:hypothetical protein
MADESSLKVDLLKTEIATTLRDFRRFAVISAAEKQILFHDFEPDPTAD